MYSSPLMVIIEKLSGLMVAMVVRRRKAMGMTTGCIWDKGMVCRERNSLDCYTLTLEFEFILWDILMGVRNSA
jgi:hypothetical protein